MLARAVKLALRRSFAGAIGLLARPLHPNARFVLLTDLGRALVPQYRFKWPAMAWWHDEPFNRYLARFGDLDLPNADRRLMLGELLRLVHEIPGDTAECGVFMGAGSYAICAANAISPHGRTHHVFDSFEGLSAPEHADGAYWNRGDLSFGLEGVRRNLAEFGDQVRFYPGWIPARFPEIADRRFAFVHIDVDLHQPTKDSVEFFYPRLAAAGLLLCDDYGSTWCPGATRACDEFLADKPEKMVRLDAAGGFLIKGTSTGPQGIAARDAMGASLDISRS